MINKKCPPLLLTPQEGLVQGFVIAHQIVEDLVVNTTGKPNWSPGDNQVPGGIGFSEPAKHKPNMFGTNICSELFYRGKIDGEMIFNFWFGK